MPIIVLVYNIYHISSQIIKLINKYILCQFIFCLCGYDFCLFENIYPEKQNYKGRDKMTK